MPALLVIVALLAVGFLVMWVRSNRALLAHQAEAAATQAMLATERNEARAEATTRTTERDETRARLKTRTSELEARTGELEAARAQITRLEAQRSQLSGAVRRQTGEIDELRSTVAEQEARIEAQSNEIGTFVPCNTPCAVCVIEVMPRRLLRNHTSPPTFTMLRGALQPYSRVNSSSTMPERSPVALPIA